MPFTTRGELTALCWSLLALSTLTTGLRFYARRRQHMPLRLDDGFAVLALLANIAVVVCDLIMAHLQEKSVNTPDLATAIKAELEVLKIGLVWNIFATFACAFVKLSAVYFYRRLFVVRGQKTYFGLVTVASIVLVCVWLVAYLIALFFECGTHLSALWNGHWLEYCGPTKPLVLSWVTSNLLLDVWIMAMPIPSILMLHTTAAKKLSIIAVFMVALSGVGASIARVVIYWNFLSIPTDQENKQTIQDAQYEGASYSMLEAGICLIAINLPSIWFLIAASSPQKPLRHLKGAVSLGSLRPSDKSDHSNKGIMRSVDIEARTLNMDGHPLELEPAGGRKGRAWGITTEVSTPSASGSKGSCF